MLYQILPIKYELKLPSEATPTSFAIQNQIQAVCPPTNYQSNVTSPMSKTSDFPIDVWECQNVLDMIQKVKFSSEKLFLIKFKIFWHSQNEIGFSKHQMGIQKFRSRINSSINIYN